MSNLERFLHDQPERTPTLLKAAMREPLLYLSLYFKQHRQVYYDRLDGVRTRGDWRAWLHFFAEAVAWTAGSAVDTAHRLTTLFQADRGRIQATGRGASSLLQVHGALQARPLPTIASVAASTRLTIPTETKALDGLRALGIVRETTGRRRGRVYAYDQYLQLLSAGTERP